MLFANYLINGEKAIFEYTKEDLQPLFNPIPQIKTKEKLKSHLVR